eukprot:4831671-Prymnesium_polylepis.2
MACEAVCSVGASAVSAVSRRDRARTSRSRVRRRVRAPGPGPAPSGPRHSRRPVCSLWLARESSRFTHPTLSTAPRARREWIG